MLQKIWKYGQTIVTRFFQEGITTHAAGLAYVTLLSLVPLLTVVLSILSAFPIFEGMQEKIQHLLFSNLVASSAQTVQQHLQIFIAQTSKLSPASMAFLFITAVLMIFSMEQAFNHIWRIRKRRNIIQAFLMYWAVLTLIPILIGLGYAISNYLMGFAIVSGAAALPGIKAIANSIAPYLFTFLALTFLYLTVPNCKVKFVHAALGAIIAAILFELAKYGFTFYLTNFPTYRLLYGALATIPIFLVWLYLSWLIILFGAVISHTVGKS